MVKRLKCKAFNILSEFHKIHIILSVHLIFQFLVISISYDFGDKKSQKHLQRDSQR